MTELSQSVTGRSMGRPPLKKDVKVKKVTVWMHEDLTTRIVGLVGGQGMSAFFREAAEAELARRERLAKRKAKPPQ